MIALAGGALSAASVISNWPALAGSRNGPWITLPALARPEADPYLRAWQQSAPQMALGTAEGAVFTAASDSDGNPLQPGCTYEIAGSPPLARLFTLRAESPDGVLLEAGDPLPSFLHSDMLLFRPKHLSIMVGPKPAPGNWLAVRSEGGYRLVLTLYDVAVTDDDIGGAVDMPGIKRMECVDG